MKYCLTLLLLFLAKTISAQIYYKSGTFKVENATKMVVYPGVMGSPITTTVSFRMVMKSCTRLAMDSFWMDGFSDKINIRYANGENWDSKPMKGDTLYVSLEYFRTTAEGPLRDEMEITGSKESQVPIKHTGKALFRYKMAGKSYYFSIKEIKELESVYAP